MSHFGTWDAERERGTLWCLVASLFAAWTFSSHSKHSAASSAQQRTLASAASHTLHWIFMAILNRVGASYGDPVGRGWREKRNFKAWVCEREGNTRAKKEEGGEQNKMRDIFEGREDECHVAGTPTLGGFGPDRTGRFTLVVFGILN